MYDKLQSVCPWYIGKQPNSTFTCCDLNQINSLSANYFKMAERLLGNCPSCVQNFMKVFCAITCDPSNSVFMNVGIFYPDNISIGIVNVYFANHYANQLYNSCKDINVQDSHGCSKVVSTYFCNGNYGQCSGQLWLESLGTPQPILPVPFVLNFTFTNDPSGHDLPTNMSALNGTLLKCSDPVDGVTCTCKDCPAMCPHTLPNNGSVSIPFLAIGIFVGMISFTIYNVVYMYILVVSSSPVTAKKYTNPSSNGTSYCSPCDDQKVDRASWISQLFSWWEHVTTNYWYFIVPAVIVVFVFLTGMTLCEVKTDTVETWSASITGDQAQRDTEYFNQYFGGSYHASQIIITAPNSPGFTFSDPERYSIIYNASGMFRQYILNEVSVVLIPDT